MARISPELLSLLRCPVTGAALKQDGEVLVTTGSGEKLRYGIDEGIPVLLRPELLEAATVAGSDEHDAPAS
jgi:uncharacterized protein YbaR (Trm112 family)